MRTSTLITLAAAVLLSAPALAAEPGASAKPAASPGACVDVEVGGYRALSYDCLSRQMAPTENRAPGNPALASEDIAKQAPNRLGLFNQSATSNRMGNQFGKSAFPQRPPAAQGASPLLGGK
ncbi:hypothetical protein [Pollutimonas bauzanensis]|uniref:PsiF repeat-containing protein n=1 Tax=Pollutimonas bauzanensis TaxID=658167 RepID=A0A1M5ZM14_9BURK|nr:hypothetical protein [Pollutimonas bauzanensis]SHI25357.1 hypothetical protein SAMN04488135_11626 [Pollutimonas bauzanensis]